AEAGGWRNLDGGTVRVKAGTPKTIRRIINCRFGTVDSSVSGIADHGTITVRTGTSNACNNPKQPTVFVIYTSNPGFVGHDTASVFFPARLMMDIVVE
ncbi:MAG: hypothetical protein P4L98_11830, partial [Ancalomicrobiaceae bacterium]|nr:hypothetical protein [Ancalomicrobiaceae bacterium]